jgi:hypothetical protein
MYLGSNANINCFQVILAGGPQDIEVKEFRRKKDALELARKVSLSLELPVIARPLLARGLPPAGVRSRGKTNDARSNLRPNAAPFLHLPDNGTRGQVVAICILYFHRALIVNRSL